MPKNIPILLITQNNSTSIGIIEELSVYTVDLIESKPTYTSYLKVLQYLPAVVIMELPQKFHDQLHFIQMFKQNTHAHLIPVVSYGPELPEKVVGSLRKIGIDEYWPLPLDVAELAGSTVKKIRQRGMVLQKKHATGEEKVTYDIDKMLSAKIKREEKVALMMAHIGDMMAFPFTLAMALKLLSNNSCGVNELAKTIETDPAISAKFLKLANSVYYAGRNARISTIKDAVVRIGFDETRRMISGMAVMQLFDDATNSAGFNRVEFWMHCLSTAIIAEKLATMSGKVNPEEAFLAGILHDFGIILLDEFFPELFATVLQKSTDTGIRFFDAEMEVLSVHHNEIVKRLFEVWKMPERIANAVVNHYQAVEFEGDDRKKVDPLMLITGIANIMAKSYCFGISCDQCVTRLDNELFAVIDLPFGLPHDFYRTTKDTITEYRKCISIDDVPLHHSVHGDAPVPKRIGYVDFCGLLFSPVKEFMRNSGYVLVELPPVVQHAGCEQNCDAIVAFVDEQVTPEMVAPFESIERKAPDGTDLGPVPVVLVVNSNHPSTATARETVSVLPDTIDVRMLELHIGSIVQGTRVRLAVLQEKKPNATKSSVKSDEKTVELKALFKQMQHYREKCLIGGIQGEDCSAAAEYLQKARSAEHGAEYSYVESMVGLAAEHYRKAYLQHELAECDERIQQKKRMAEIWQ